MSISLALCTCGGVSATTWYVEGKAPVSSDGRNWIWKPITKNSGVHNIRPTMPIWNEQKTAILWLRGTYRTCTDYDLEVVGIIVSNK